MSDWRLKAVLIVSLVFNVSVIGTAAFVWAVNRQDQSEMIAVKCGHEESCRIRSHDLARGIGLCESTTVHFEKAMLVSCGEEEQERVVLDRAREELIMLLHSDHPDTVAVMKKVEEISLSQQRLEKMIVRRLIRSQSVLDPHEREKFHKIIGCCPVQQCPGMHREHRTEDTSRKDGE